MIVCGIDIGSRTVKALLFDPESRAVVAHEIQDVGPDPVSASREAFHRVLETRGFRHEDIVRTVATGYGRKSFPHARMAVTEITCHAKGTAFLFPDARAVLDVGGQDSKAIAFDGSGAVLDFAMNDRCAAGTGRFLEMVSGILHIPLERMGGAVRDAKQAAEINSMCAVFAESEIVGLLARGWAREEVLLGVMESIARRLVTMAGQIETGGTVVFSGGVAKNAGMVRVLEGHFKSRLAVPEEPRITAALGAALIGAERREGT